LSRHIIRQNFLVGFYYLKYACYKNLKNKLEPFLHPPSSDIDIKLLQQDIAKLITYMHYEDVPEVEEAEILRRTLRAKAERHWRYPSSVPLIPEVALDQNVVKRNPHE
jgi:hypothetical protein